MRISCRVIARSEATKQSILSCCDKAGLLRFARNDGDSAVSTSPRNRQLRLRIEEVQAAGLGGEADLIAARDLCFRRHASRGDAGAADAGLQQDFRAELLDDFDAGV